MALQRAPSLQSHRGGDSLPNCPLPVPANSKRPKGLVGLFSKPARREAWRESLGETLSPTLCSSKREGLCKEAWRESLGARWPPPAIEGEILSPTLPFGKSSWGENLVALPLLEERGVQSKTKRFSPGPTPQLRLSRRERKGFYKDSSQQTELFNKYCTY
jgi:hypothetical protein